MLKHTLCSTQSNCYYLRYVLQRGLFASYVIMFAKGMINNCLLSAKFMVDRKGGPIGKVVVFDLNDVVFTSSTVVFCDIIKPLTPLIT